MNDGDENVVRSGGDHFVEREECFNSIELVCHAAIAGHGVPVIKTEEPRPEDAIVERVIAILEKYQEQSHLLDSHMENMVTKLMDTVIQVLKLRNADKKETEELESFPFQVYHNYGLQLVLKLLYTLCKVRGYKSVIKHLPHQVSELEPTLWLLQSQDSKDYSTWETRYSLLLWMSMLVIIPFDLSSVDSSQDGAPSLVTTITELCKGYLSDSGPCREAAAICLARLLTRPDMEASHLELFLTWTTKVLEEISTRRDKNDSIATDTFSVTGVFQALTEIFKYGHREKLIAHIPVIFSRVLTITKREGQSSLERKLTVKLVQRTGLNFLPPKVVSWRYQRGKRSLLSNMSGTNDQEKKQDEQVASEEADYDVPEEVEDVIETLLCGLRDRDTIVRWSAAKGIGRITSRLPLELADDVVAFVLELFDVSEGDSAWHGGCLALAELARRGLLLPDRLNKVVPLVVDALVYDVRRGPNSVGANVRDAACYVCWAFARAYEPGVMAPHVAELCPQMLVTAVYDREVNCRRAASAAFQENVGRQGHENFPHGIEILTAADYFLLGVRTNAYLQISAFIAQFEMYRKPLIRHLVDRKLSHWDLDLRILSADTLFVLCAKDPEYMAKTILPELLPNALSPDMLIRHGATLGIGSLVKALALVPYQLEDAMLADIRNTIMRIEKARLYRGRGGEWMRVAACKLIEAMALAGHSLSFRTQKRLLESIEESLKHPKDEVKEASVAALKALATNYFGNSSKSDGGIDSIFTTGNHQGATLGSISASTLISVDSDVLSAITRPASPLDMEPANDVVVKLLVDSHCSRLEEVDPNPAVRRGCALALGVLPAHVIGSSTNVLDRVVRALIQASRQETNVDLRDAETRRNAIISLGLLVETIGIEIGQTTRCQALTPQHISEIFDILLSSCEDYETDNRGDVGSWVRSVAIKALLKVINTIRTFPAQMHLSNRGNEAFESSLGGSATIIAKAPSYHGDIAVVKVSSDPEGIVRKVALSKVREKNEDSSFRVPPLADRAGALIEQAGNKAIQSINNQKPILELGAHIKTCMNHYLPPDRCVAVINTILKLVCEKIGILREVAGNALVELLLTADSPEIGIPFTIPHLKFMKEVFTTDSGAIRNWKAEAYTFPLVAKVLGLSEYIDAAMGGLVLSIGDLTESVSSNASDSLIAWCKERKANHGFAELTALGASLIKSLEENSKVDRVVVPALKTLDLLLEQQIFNYDKSPKMQWLLRVHDAIKVEIKGSTNVAKLLVCARVLLHLASFPAPCNVIALGSFLVLQGHKFPSVRMECAKAFSIWALAADPQSVCCDETAKDTFSDDKNNTEQQVGGDLASFVREETARYERELANRPDALRPPLPSPTYDPEVAFEQAQDIIAETRWDKVSTKEARSQRDKLYPLLRVTKLVKAPVEHVDVETKKEQDGIEDSSYADLIHSTEMGYR